MGNEGTYTFLHNALGTLPESTLSDYVAGFSRRHGIASAWAKFMQKYPLILGPVSTDPAFVIGKDIASEEDTQDVLRSLRLTIAINLLGLPSVAVPVGVVNGLPQGVQIISRGFREDLCLDAGEAIENELGNLTPIDVKA